jgi:hypothetical protein
MKIYVYKNSEESLPKRNNYISEKYIGYINL